MSAPSRSLGLQLPSLSVCVFGYGEYHAVYIPNLPFFLTYLGVLAMRRRFDLPHF